MRTISHIIRWPLKSNEYGYTHKCVIAIVLEDGSVYAKPGWWNNESLTTLKFSLQKSYGFDDTRIMAREIHSGINKAIRYSDTEVFMKSLSITKVNALLYRGEGQWQLIEEGKHETD